MSELDVQSILDRLPVEPTERVKKLYHENLDYVGGHYTVVRRVSREDPPEMGELMVGIKRKRTRSWYGECTCSDCLESWYTRWVCAGVIEVYTGPDDLFYPLCGSSIADDYCPDGFISPVTSGGAIVCPECGANTTVVFASELRPSRRMTRMFQTVEVIGGYAAVVSWLGSRSVDRDALIDDRIVPWLAHVVMEDGKLLALRYESRRWELSKSKTAPEFTVYHSPDFINGRGIEGVASHGCPSLIGTTGEKTGLYSYVTNGGLKPVCYLMVWGASRNIEMLMHTPFSGAVRVLIDRALSDNASACCWKQMLREHGTKIELPFDFDANKPNRMLRMDKASFRQLCQPDAPEWSAEELNIWMLYLEHGGKCDAVAFHGYWSRYKLDGITRMLSMMGDQPGVDLPQIDKYLVGKQGLGVDDLHLIEDMWSMFHAAYLRKPQTREELWPRRLIAAHDRLAAMTRNADDAALQDGFDRISRLCSGLLWTDGDLCVTLPASNSELVHEGEVLRHCVGGYGTSHVAGSAVIFFVRHCRRPERPYYTLSIDLTGKKPKRVQLHGYGNERHGDLKQYTHRIPPRVLDFCARWESDILAPWWIARQNEEVSA